MEDIISNWHVTKLQSESDHKIIQFELAIPKVERKTKTFMSEKNKTDFRTQLEQASNDYLETLDKSFTSVDALETITNKFINTVKELHKTNSRTYQIKIKPRQT